MSSGTACGLGYDDSRDVFVVTDCDADVILLVNPSTGAITASFPTVSGGPVGAAYDSTRDGYWVADWESDRIEFYDATTQVFVRSCPMFGHNRVGGVGYSPVADVLVFNIRDSATTNVIRAGDCSHVVTVPTPPGPGNNNGMGAAVRQTAQTVFLANFDVDIIYEVDFVGVVPAELQSFAVR